MAAMNENTIWIKQEEMNDRPNDPESMDFEFVLVKEEPIEDPDELTSPAPEENPPEVIIKEEPVEKEAVGCDVGAGAQQVATSAGSESNSTGLIQHSNESCYISSEETVKQEMVPSELGAGESISFTMFGIHAQQREEEQEEDSLFGSRLKCSSREKEFHKFTCSFCLQSFPSKYRLIMHVFNHIDGVRPPTYVCESCGEVFQSNISFNRHVKMYAGVQGPVDGHIYNHEIIVEGDQEVSFTDQIDKQPSNKKTRRISRKLCNDSYNTHNFTSDAEIQVRLNNCGTSSTTGNVNHRALTFTYKCDLCGKAFTRLDHFKRHGLIHAEIKSHTCNICGKSYIRADYLKMHSLIHTGIRVYKCDICDISFARLSNLKRHSLIHTGLKVHKCDTCDKCFAHLHGLKQHLSVHAGSKQHNCEICGKSFPHLRSLKQHLLTHTGSKPHKCDICGNFFTRSGDLKKHSVIHTGLKPHKCNTCGKSYTDPSNLKRHSATHNTKTT